jgi:hypothetical protein
MIRHGRISCLERLPVLEAVLPCDQFLRVAELKILRENFGIGHLAETGQTRPDLRRDRMIAVTVPTQNELGLFPQVFEIGHGRGYG